MDAREGERETRTTPASEFERRQRFDRSIVRSCVSERMEEFVTVI